MKRLLLPLPLLLAALCSGCGQKGDLYLPSPATPPADAPAQGSDNGAQDRDHRDDDGDG